VGARLNCDQVASEAVARSRGAAATAGDLNESFMVGPGLPLRLRSDNGPPFASTGARPNVLVTSGGAAAGSGSARSPARN
jgi:hypothetical protein